MSSQRGGRPPKRRGSLRPNAGRKRVKLSENETVSPRTIERRAQELANSPDINEEVLLRALQIVRNNSVNSNNSNEEHVEPQTYTIPHTASSALSFYIENDYTVAEYKNLVKDTKSRIIGQPNIYPSYNLIDEEKRNCLKGLIVEEETEVTYRASLQSILNMSTERLVESIDNQEVPQDIKLFVSYGFDSSSGHKNTHQRFEESEHVSYASHQHLFASVLVLLAIKHEDEIIWLNSTPQSTRYCRPIRLSYEKETVETTRNEHEGLKEEISQL